MCKLRHSTVMTSATNMQENALVVGTWSNNKIVE